MPSIDAIANIDQKSATKLRKAGVRTTEGLLRRAATRGDRNRLAEQTGFNPSQLLRWAHRADLMRVKGIGSEYAELLEAAGVQTLGELRRRNPKALTTRIAETNGSERLVRRLPTESMVAGWVADAERLSSLVRS